MNIEEIFKDAEELTDSFWKTPRVFQDRVRSYMEFKKYESFVCIPPEERKEMLALFKKNEEKT